MIHEEDDPYYGKKLTCKECLATYKNFGRYAGSTCFSCWSKVNPNWNGKLKTRSELFADIFIGHK